MTTIRSTMLRAFALLLLAAAVSACGFKLRGSDGQFNMPFKSIYLGFAVTSPLGTELKRNLRAVDTEVLEEAARAEALFDVLGETRGKSILSLNAQGRVREYLLTYTLVFRVRDRNGAELLKSTDISLKRSITFNERQVLANESEEALLYRDMQTDLVQQILRRLAAIKPL
ncbi:MAG: LPS assembly lipoprotein LptE [Pseudomonadota bacterium]